MFLQISQNSQENTCNRKHLCQSLKHLFEALGLQLYWKKGLRHRCFPENFVKFSKTSFFIVQLQSLLLKFIWSNSIYNDSAVRLEALDLDIENRIFFIDGFFLLTYLIWSTTFNINPNKAGLFEGNFFWWSISLPNSVQISRRTNLISIYICTTVKQPISSRLKVKKMPTSFVTCWRH